MSFKRFAVLMVLVLAVASCGGDDETPGSGSGEPASSTTVDNDNTAPPVTEATTTTILSGAGGESCLVGTWELDSDAFFEEVFAEFPVEEQGVEPDSIDTTGVYRVTMSDDGTIVSERDEWGFAIVTSEGTFIVEISGSESGTWAVEDDVLSIDLEPDGPTTVVAKAIIAGEEIQLPAPPFDVPGEAVAESAPYTCDNDTFTVSVDAVTSTFDRS